MNFAQVKLDPNKKKRGNLRKPAQPPNTTNLRAVLEIASLIKGWNSDHESWIPHSLAIVNLPPLPGHVHPLGNKGLITGWWFQPIWKILVKIGIFPKSGWKYKMFETTT